MSKVSLSVSGVRISGQPSLEIDKRFQDVMAASLRESVEIKTARGVNDITIEADSDDVVEVILEDDIVLYTTLGRFEEEYLTQTRGSQKTIVVPQSLHAGESTRGLISYVLKKFGIIDVETTLAEPIAEYLKNKVESKIIGNTDAIYKISDIQTADVVGESNLNPVKPDELLISDNSPVLLFIHGTASSTAGSFADLWEDESDGLWETISQNYVSQNIVGFEHYTLGLSPIENAVNLLKALPQKAKLHIVTHSRGGLVGELICRGQLADGHPAFTDDDLAFFDSEKNTQLSSLLNIIQDENNATKNNNPYEKQKGLLQELNTLLEEKEIVVERFVRVACPARGTTLASNKLDLYFSALLNVIGHIPILKASPIYSFMKTLLLAIAERKSSAEQIPGLEAQMPGSPTILMLNNGQGSSLAPLSVIEGDIEPDGIFKKIAMLLVDRFYASDHDLVVNTPSMDGGTTRRFNIFTKFVQGNHVNHFSYFENNDSRKSIVTALKQTTPPGFVERKQIPKVIARSLPRGKNTGEVPAVFILPGILGSELIDEDDLIWVDKFGLLWGGFGKLNIQNNKITAEKPLASTYGALADFLGNRYEVIPFAYDWRKSIKVAGDNLAVVITQYLDKSDQPVRFIVHSMGGLVFRSMVTYHPKVWDRLCRRDGTRVLMLGTPNDGSHSIIRVLLGHEKLIKLLALLDLKHDKTEILDFIRKFPGVLELLPRESNGGLNSARFFSEEIWKSIRQTQDKDWHPPLKTALAKADNFWKKLHAQTLDSKRFFYIAGKADQTPVDIEIDSNGKQLKVLSTQQGDGRVPWDNGIPEGIQHWFVDAQHGDLANHPPTFKAIAEIIETGTTDTLSTEAPVTRGIDDKVEMPADTVDYLPDEETLIRSALGSTGKVAAKTELILPPLAISITHGDLCFINKPVAVGHYLDDDIVSAEAVLDQQLQGRLTQRHQLGLYPGQINTNEIVLDCNPAGEITGAVIIGLGEVGTLTPGSLTSSVHTAILRYALNIAEGKYFTEREIKLAFLLVGSGSGGISLDNVLNSIIRGVLQANKELAGDAKNTDRTINSLEFIELYEDHAALAQHYLNQIANNATFRKQVRVESHVRKIEGALRRPYILEQDHWWPRIRISARPDGALNFTIIAEGARIPMEITATQRRSVEPFLKQATSSILTADKVGRVLFELLVPSDFKHHAPENRDLVLVVDKDTAQYPWELMEYPTAEGDKPLASDASVIRQLVMAGANNASTTRGETVIIADPDLKSSGYPQLPGAVREGKSVASLFKQDSSWKTPLVMIDPKPAGIEIIRELMTREIQILHIAGHGVVNHEVASLGEDNNSSTRKTDKLTGVLIGEDHVLTAAEIQQMPSTPQLAFINACYLGKMSDKNNKLKQPNLLAADFGVSLIQKGIRAVVVAGWEVQDAAAEIFAKTFYAQMLSGQKFGRAVRAAREQTRKAYPQYNTWGAYQCYGDPGFCLVDTSRATSKDKNKKTHYVSLNHCIIEIENITEKAKTASDPSYLENRLNSILQDMPDNWKNESEVEASLGRAWGELRQFDLAIKAYEAAARAEKPATTIKDLEQLANLKARYAIELHDTGDDKNAMDYIKNAIDILTKLNDEHGETIERLNLLGSTYKRRAYIFKPKTSRKSALVNACKYYEKANKLAMKKNNGKPIAYSLINLLSLLHILKYYDTKYKIDQKQVDDWVSKLRKDKPDIKVSRENFWQAITNTDLDVVVATLNNSLDKEADKIIEYYNKIRNHASSPRQFGSVLEHLQILHQLANELLGAESGKTRKDDKNNLKNLATALHRIIDHLSL
ncbi:MAG TPA: CHAT domain-containing protein [Chromatiales bacterium]|nr:CHAT domain-containing protein [Thiotrichales bacterium]HIP67956.1 CHAT domain-containing protein [Chromatiales bacterium]